MSEAEALLVKRIYNTENLIDCEITENIIQDISKVFKSDNAKKLSVAAMVSLMLPIISSSQSLDTIKSTQGADEFLKKIYKKTKNSDYDISKDSLALMSGSEFKDLVTRAAKEYAKADPNFYIKGTEPKNSKVIKNISMLAPNFIKTDKEHSRFDKQFKTAINNNKKSFVFIKDNEKEIKIFVKKDPNIKKYIASDGKIEWVPAINKAKN